MKVDRNLVIAAAGGATIAYFLDMFGTLGDVAAGTALGFVVGHPVIGGAAAFLMPSRQTVSGWLGRPPDGSLRVIPGKRKGAVYGGLGPKDYSAPREQAKKDPFAKWALDARGFPRGWYGGSGQLRTDKPDERHRAEAAHHYRALEREAQRWMQAASVAQAEGKTGEYSAALIAAELAIEEAQLWGRYA